MRFFGMIISKKQKEGSGLRELILKDDKYKMNWAEGTAEWGTVKASKGIEVSTSTEPVGGVIRESYVFTNVTDKDIFTSLRDIGIYATFNDDYIDSEKCMTNRCHMHIWCGGDVSYVMALRMGGEPPHLGLVLTEGSLGGYSVERDFSKISNDRGDLILHPSPMSLAPGESRVMSWTLFEHSGKADFYEKLGQICTRYIYVSAENYVVFSGERIHLELRPVFKFSNARIVCGGRNIDFNMCDNTIVIDETADDAGSRTYEIDIDGVKTYCNILVQPRLEELVRARCRFIAEKQQYDAPNSGLDGAFLIYDNEEGHIYYSRENDRNGGRERVCMGILLARYLQCVHDEIIGESLKKYIWYAERELVDTESGTVYNDYGRDDSFERLYNYPWMSLFYLELYSLYTERRYLETAYRILKEFYARGGSRFYAIEIPLKRICGELERAEMYEYRTELLRKFTEHCDHLLARGTHYPAHEVNYEQSIVAPAADLLLQMYEITGDTKYLDGGRKQLEVLGLFNGSQPDCRMYETAIRHWDGYWFGKRRLYGDTYPHYWSALTANVYERYGRITGDAEYMQKAEAAYRGVLNLFRADGTASCAYVYPVSVNGKCGSYFDPYANDQDWGLYFMLRHRITNHNE